MEINQVSVWQGNENEDEEDTSFALIEEMKITQALH
jgi:hypothetical protein